MVPILIFTDTLRAPRNAKGAYVDKSDTFHSRFIERTGDRRFRASSEAVEESTEYETYPDTDTENPPFTSIQHTGHFVLLFDDKRAPEMPHLGWRVGKGKSKSPTNRGVDLLLAKSGDILGKSLASTHMLFRFNLGSGFLMLSAGSLKVPAEFKSGGIWEKLEYKEETLMHQPATMLRAGACEYELEYTVKEHHREPYFQKRDVLLSALSPRRGDAAQAFQKMPGDSYVLRGRYLEFETKGSGAFGWITQGVDTKTGNPVAIKELRLNSRSSRLEILAEIKIGRRLLDERGLLPILNACCEHGLSNGCDALKKFCIFMPYARSNLAIDFWTSPEIPRKTKLYWLRELLEGIRTLHTKGIMHHDVRPKNMLILSIEPPRAAMCDYGKAVEAENSAVTTIGPIHTLAPEVWTVSTDGPYTAKIDMWAYDYAVAEILGYSIARHPRTEGFHTTNSKITHNRHSAILAMLRAHCDKIPEDKPLVDLMSKLLVWEPEGRWSADQALQHECWNPVRQEQEVDKKGTESGAESEPSRTKRSRLQDRRLESNETPAPALDDTQEFSQETKNLIQSRLDR